MRDNEEVEEQPGISLGMAPAPSVLPSLLGPCCLQLVLTLRKVSQGF